MATKQNNTQATAQTTLETELGKLPTTSAKIRYLKALGHKVSQICKVLKYKDGRDLRPQHVYNVLKTPLANKT